MSVSGFEVENIVLCVKKCIWKWSWQNVRVDQKPNEIFCIYSNFSDYYYELDDDRWEKWF